MDVVVKEWDVPKVMEIIGEGARTGNVGDGKIFVIDASEAMRIRTGETGVKAISQAIRGSVQMPPPEGGSTKPPRTDNEILQPAHKE